MVRKNGRQDIPLSHPNVNMKAKIRALFAGSEWKIFVVFSLIILNTLFAYRLVFYAIYSYRSMNSSFFLVAKAFLLGLRFDLATTGILLGPLFFLANLWFANRWRIYSALWGLTAIFLYFWMFAILISDLVYYENAGKHIGYEAFVFLTDLDVIFRSAWEKNPFPLVLGFAAIFLLLPYLFYLYWRKNPYQHEKGISLSTRCLRILFAVVISIILVRGGVQEVPLRASYAIISNDTFINNLSLNGAYTALMDMKGHSIPKSEKMPLRQAVEIFREKAAYPGSEFISEKYPLLRKTQAAAEAKELPNIVLILLENWTGKFVSPITDGKVDGKVVAPHFNALAKQGIFFKNFFACGGRTTNGMMSIYSGIPDWPGLTAVRTPKILGNFSGLGSVMQQLGYQTLFVTGGALKFDNKHTLMPHWGFQKVMGQKYLANLNRYKLGAWGYDDGDILEVLHQEIEKLPQDKPFLATALTLTTHYPYRVPDKKFAIFDEKTKDFEFLNVYHYADWAIHKFVQLARSSSYFSNTIFLFVADHTHHRYLNYYEDRNIPFLIYSPLLKPELRTDVASQLDIMPTILGYTGRDVYFSSMGRDLNRVPKEGGQAYFAYGPVFGWLENNVFFSRGAQGQGTLVLRAKPPYGYSDLCKKNPIACKKQYDAAKAYLNLSLDLVEKNLVFPVNRELEQIKQR